MSSSAAHGIIQLCCCCKWPVACGTLTLAHALYYLILLGPTLVIHLALVGQMGTSKDTAMQARPCSGLVDGRTKATADPSVSLRTAAYYCARRAQWDATWHCQSCDLDSVFYLPQDPLYQVGRVLHAFLVCDRIVKVDYSPMVVLG